MNRRRFAGTLAGCALGGGMLARFLGGSLSAQDAVDFALPQGETGVGLAPALHYEKLPGLKVVCKLCPRECRVADAERGTCGVRENRGGEYFTLVYGRTCSIHVDPIEKKPLFHVLPGSPALSLATAGCNMECRFCQNWEISQFRPEQVPSLEAPPEGVLAAARQAQAPVVAYTYNEPTVFYEYMREIARVTSAAGLRNVVISNGYIQEKPLRELAPYLTAYKVDLKAFTEGFYADQCSATLAPVLATLKTLESIGLWTEIVVLIIPTLNDDPASSRAMFRWVMENMGPDVPVHLTRFHPTYKIDNLPSTPVETMEQLHAIAKEEGIHYAYLGNVPGHAAESTWCPACGTRLIERYGYVVASSALRGGHCPKCDLAIPGVWS
jgi:pyruvate formate lyase activating enzyme